VLYLYFVLLVEFNHKVRLYGDRELDMVFHQSYFVNEMDMKLGSDFFEGGLEQDIR